MSPSAVVTHCPECGAITRRDEADDGYIYDVCSNDDCTRIVVAVVARPAPVKS
jgi:hypothetical protein